jgi:hypothetical protein
VTYKNLESALIRRKNPRRALIGGVDWETKMAGTSALVTGEPLSVSAATPHGRL